MMGTKILLTNRRDSLAFGFVGFCQDLQGASDARLTSLAFAPWRIQTVNTKADFRGRCVVSPKVAWVSGTKGTDARTSDNGKNWAVGTVPGAEKLDFYFSGTGSTRES